ncbi:MAG: ATP-grasp domain-containing protein [Dehalococcoidales bacterium]|nr:ATP-grasp domain-containing protein [Dehalococcoidales bacterium]
MKIGLSYDLKEAVSSEKDQPEDALEEYDSLETVNGLKRAIESAGHTVVLLGGGREFVKNLLTQQVDFVFNISEGRGAYRSREAQAPSVLEMLDIPYSGSDPQCLAVCLDKHLTKKIVSMEGISTPRWSVIASGRTESIDWEALPYPAFVKPVWEGSSKGIRLNSLVKEPQEMKRLVTALLSRYRQPVLVEEFIAGDEVTVGITGNSPPEILGIMRVVPRKKDVNFVYSLEVKRDYENLVDYECPAGLDNGILIKIRENSLKIFEVLGCRDFGRVDFRLGTDGVPYFLEINPLAGLNPRSSDLIIMAGLTGIEYNRVIRNILEAALRRSALCSPK